MSNASTTLTGRLTADPVLRLTNGQNLSVANFTVAHTPRSKNASTGEWEDSGETLFVRVTAWRELGENVAGSLHKGDMVTVTGDLGIRHYPKSDGTEGTEVICTADSVAVDLRFQTVTVTRFVKGGAPAADEAWALAPASAAAA
jgi:single-strand DNA-binding protein